MIVSLIDIDPIIDLNIRTMNLPTTVPVFNPGLENSEAVPTTAVIAIAVAIIVWAYRKISLTWKPLGMVPIAFVASIAAMVVTAAVRYLSDSQVSTLYTIITMAMAAVGSGGIATWMNLAAFNPSDPALNKNNVDSSELQRANLEVIDPTTGQPVMKTVYIPKESKSSASSVVKMLLVMLLSIGAAGAIVTQPGCALFDSMFSKDSPLETRLYYAQESYNSIGETLVSLREQGLIDDQMFRRIDPVLKATDTAFTVAYSYVAIGDKTNAESEYEKITDSIESLTRTINTIKAEHESPH